MDGAACRRRRRVSRAGVCRRRPSATSRCAAASRAAARARRRGARRGRLRCAPRRLRARRATPRVGWVGSAASRPRARHNRASAKPPVIRAVAPGPVRAGDHPGDPPRAYRTAIRLRHPTRSHVHRSLLVSQGCPEYGVRARRLRQPCARNSDCAGILEGPGEHRAVRVEGRLELFGGPGPGAAPIFQVPTLRRSSARTCRSHSSPARAAPSAGVSSHTVRSRVSNVNVAVAGALHPGLAQWRRT